MNALRKEIRNRLAKTVLEARQKAEEAAKKALHTLGVDEPDAPGHLDADHRKLRVQLRSQARQLGDREDPQKKGRYQIKHLAEKIGYDQWHRMLFAQFLAENDLLISPEHGVGVSLHDCEELAPELKLRDGWEVAALFTAKMLPEIFRADDPAGKIEFAPEDRAALREMVTGLAQEAFLADDSLGWVYQFWQAQRKEEVNASGSKIGADELAPVTQLFTEDYMVSFLLHNTLGAWWAAKQQPALKSLNSEEECRHAVALPGVSWEYLRFIKDDKTAEWRPAAGNFAGWPKRAKDLRLLDPCMGSGHFVAAELPILVAMRTAEEGLSVADAVEAVVQDNLFGLELDPRCTQIAAFNLALAAWKLIGQYRRLPPLNLACCGLPVAASRDDWLKLVPKDEKFVMGQLYDLFRNAPDLGSLLNPSRQVRQPVGQSVLHSLMGVIKQALDREEAKGDADYHEMGVTAQGLAAAAEILAGQFTLVATNVPYLGRGKQDEVLLDFCERHHPAAKADLATCFVERCLDFCSTGGTAVMVTPQNWLFLGTYKKLRIRLLDETTWDFVVNLGPAAFEDMNWWAATTVLVGLTRSVAVALHRIACVNVSPPRDPKEKAILLPKERLWFPTQAGQSKNPDSRILFEESSDTKRLSAYARSLTGLQTSDNDRYSFLFWELPSLWPGWEFFQRTSDSISHYSGRLRILRSADEGLGAQRCRGHNGVLVHRMNALPITLLSGDNFDQNGAGIIPSTPKLTSAIWCFLASPEFRVEVRKLDTKVGVTPATLVKVPFDLLHWQNVAAEKYPHGLPKPHSDDPTQWLFNGHPKGSTAPLQVAVARLLGYRWPRQTGSSFPDCPALKADGLEKFADADGIVCLNAIKGEQPAAERLRALLAAAFGREWSAARQAELLAQAVYAGATLEDWLRNGFFEHHCQMFHQRPFIWQIWDGLRDGFSALVNYHQLDRKTLEKLTYTYLGDWIARQKAAVAAGEEGSDAKLAAAQELKTALENILEGEPPYDIFVRWKPLEQQPVGWDPDLNDGVRLNIRPIVEAGILRKTPKINWNKDRGKDVACAPWYSKFKGDRINDHHLTLEEKRKAREPRTTARSRK